MDTAKLLIWLCENKLPDDRETVVNPSLLSPEAVTRSNSPRLPAGNESYCYSV